VVCSYRELALWMRGDGETSGRMSEFSGWQHMMSLSVVIIDGDSAQACTDFLSIHKLKSSGGQAHRLDAPGAFHDTLARTPDGWRITHRRYEVYFIDLVPTELVEDGAAH